MELTTTPLISGKIGKLGKHIVQEAVLLGLSREASFHLDHPRSKVPVDQAVLPIASAQGLRSICLVGADRPSPESLALEDALRYHADLKALAFSVVRINADKLLSEAASQSLAAEIAECAKQGISKTIRPAPVVLITGALGQLGRAMGALLDRKGVKHLGIDIVEPKEPSDRFLRCDLGDPAEIGRLAEFCRPVTHVIHLASRITNEKDLRQSFEAQYRMNVTGTKNLLKALPPALRHIAYASSMTVYGNTDVPLVDESHPIRPNCIYALCKVIVERHLAEHSRRTGVKSAFLRYTSAYGPGPRTGRAIPAMIGRLLDGEAPEIFGDGSARRDYIYVDDLCEATYQAVVKEADGPFNIGTGRGISAAELAELLIRLTGVQVSPKFIPREQDAQARSSLVFDISKMVRELEFRPSITIEDGLSRLIAQLRHPELRQIASV